MSSRRRRDGVVGGGGSVWKAMGIGCTIGCTMGVTGCAAGGDVTGAGAGAGAGPSGSSGTSWVYGATGAGAVFDGATAVFGAATAAGGGAGRGSRPGLGGTACATRTKGNHVMGTRLLRDRRGSRGYPRRRCGGVRGRKS